ncbi:PaaI family thioesterase [Pseudonocardia spinosispora]|uniref:PaaI family thioesterase n=1 Tax=Pseudonocardia spinosispora TaxID=103441 RepID=UPI00048EAF39|nr:PaaI family thioesterase [Pseudonocardia spinosispora]
MNRTRTHSWVDPSELAVATRATDGLVFSRLLASHRLGPMPMAATLGYTFTEADHGRVVFVGVPREVVCGPTGFVHGGFAAAMLDSAAGFAVHTTLPAGTGYTTLDLSVHHLRPITTETGPVRAVGTLLSRGRRTALARAELRDPMGRLLASAVSSCMLFPPEG